MWLAGLRVCLLLLVVLVLYDFVLLDFRVFGFDIWCFWLVVWFWFWFWFRCALVVTMFVICVGCDFCFFWVFDVVFVECFDYCVWFCGFLLFCFVGLVYWFAVGGFVFWV